MLRKNTLSPLPALVTVAILVGCGGSDDTPATTVTVTKETTVEAPPATASAGPTGDTGTSGTGAGPDEPAKVALPGGRAAIDGRYAMKTTAYDTVVPLQYNFEWFGEETDCTGERCTLTVRRGLEGGGFKNYQLESAPDDEKKWVGESKGQGTCPGKSGKISTTERLSLRVTATDTVSGRPTARRFDAYLKVRGTCKDGEPLEGNGVLRASLDDG